MKKLVFALMLLSVSAYAQLRGAPFQPHIDSRFDELEGGQSTVSSRSGIRPKLLALATYDFDALGGASSVGTFDTGVDLPANALVTRSWIYVSQAVTSTVDTGDNAELFSFICDPATSGAGNETLLTALNLSRRTPSSNYSVEASSTGASTVFNRIESACDIKASITQANVTQGQVTLYLEYVLHPNP